MGWSKDPGSTYLAGRLPAVFYFRGIMKELSVFVDESGDFGEYEKHAPYYIITMVLHDQSVDISEQIWKLNETLKNMGYGNEQAIHTEPLIRREEPYRYFQPNERRAIFSKLFYFTIGCDIKYKSFVYRNLNMIIYLSWKREWREIYRNLLRITLHIFRTLIILFCIMIMGNMN